MWNSETNTFKFSEDFNYLKFDMYFYETKMLYPSVGILVWPNWSERAMSGCGLM